MLTVRKITLQELGRSFSLQALVEDWDSMQLDWVRLILLTTIW
jgi:hypothetical protein